MIKCIAIDDEPLALRQIVTYVSKVPYLELVASCPSAASARKVLDSEQVDVMFVDINMPDISGMEFVKSLQAPPMIVFTTAYSEYAVEGFKVDAVDYLLKPFGLDDFQRACSKVKTQYELRNTVSSVSSAGGDDSIFFKTDYKVVRVGISDIVYVEGMSEYLKIHLESRKEPVIILLSMKKLEERLPCGRFMRIHKSYIVNLAKITEVSKSRVCVGPDVYLPVGDLYREAFNGYIESKFLGK